MLAFGLDLGGLAFPLAALLFRVRTGCPFVVESLQNRLDAIQIGQPIRFHLCRFHFERRVGRVLREFIGQAFDFGFLRLREAYGLQNRRQFAQPCGEHREFFLVVLDRFA